MNFFPVNCIRNKRKGRERKRSFQSLMEDWHARPTPSANARDNLYSKTNLLHPCHLPTLSDTQKHQSKQNIDVREYLNDFVHLTDQLGPFFTGNRQDSEDQCTLRPVCWWEALRSPVARRSRTTASRVGFSGTANIQHHHPSHPPGPGKWQNHQHTSSPSPAHC